MRAKNIVGGGFDLTSLGFLATWLLDGSDIFGMLTGPFALTGVILHVMGRQTRGVLQQVNQAHQLAAQVRAGAYPAGAVPMQINVAGGPGQPRQITFIVPPNSGQPPGVLPDNIRIVQQPGQPQHQPPPPQLPPPSYGYPPSGPPHTL